MEVADEAELAEVWVAEAEPAAAPDEDAAVAVDCAAGVEVSVTPCAVRIGKEGKKEQEAGLAAGIRCGE